MNLRTLYELMEENTMSEPSVRMTYIVAGRYDEARHYAKMNSIAPPYWRFVEDAEILIGAEGDVVYTGAYHQIEDDVLDEIRTVVIEGQEKGRLTVVEEN